MSTTATGRDEILSPEMQFDPDARSPAAIEEPPRSLGRALRQIGPGLILAGSIVGTGELIATTHLGARVGFILLWLVIVSCFIKVFVQVELGRYAISSGQTSMASFMRLPGPGMLLVWWVVAMILVTQFQLGAMIGGVGYALHMALPGVSPALAKALSFWPAAGAYIAARPELPWAVLATAAAVLLLFNGGYRTIERSITSMVVLFTLMTVACVVLLPAAGRPIPWEEVGSGLTFSLPHGKDAMLAAFAMFGITGVGAQELVAYPYWCIEKGYARKAGPRDPSEGWAVRARGWLRVMKLDAWVSMLVYTISTLAFFFLGAAILHNKDAAAGLPEGVDAMTNALASMYAPVLGGRIAMWFIVIGVFAVLYSTLFGATAANARIFADALHVSGAARMTDEQKRKRWVRLFCLLPVLDLLLFVGVGNPVTMVLIGGFVQALSLPMIAAAAVYLRYRHTDRRLLAGRVWDALLWISLAALCLAAIQGLWSVYEKLRGAA